MGKAILFSAAKFSIKIAHGTNGSGDLTYVHMYVNTA